MLENFDKCRQDTMAQIALSTGKLYLRMWNISSKVTVKQNLEAKFLVFISQRHENTSIHVIKQGGGQDNVGYLSFVIDCCWGFHLTRQRQGLKTMGLRTALISIIVNVEHNICTTPGWKIILYLSLENFKLYLNLSCVKCI